MVALFQPSIQPNWGSLSFVSTLYLCPVLDRLMDKVPQKWHAEVRLGLQEALVNAVKHGNRLDPRKVISVRYKTSGNQYWWIIEDQGSGFDFENCCCAEICDEEAELSAVGDCGRGLYILNQIFDEVQWTQDGRELHLRKRIHRWFGLPLVG
ncbi:MAG: ATP-binding protein [Leptolyngbyaceae cyanobacterium]